MYKDGRIQNVHNIQNAHNEHTYKHSYNRDRQGREDNTNKMFHPALQMYNMYYTKDRWFIQ